MKRSLGASIRVDPDGEFQWFFWIEEYHCEGYIEISVSLTKLFAGFDKSFNIDKFLSVVHLL